MSRLSAVVPIKLAEGHKTDSGALLDILLCSIERFCEPGLFETIYVICPSIDVAPLQERMRAWRRLPLRVLDERTVFDSIQILRTTPGWAIQLESKRYHPGWWKESCRILGCRTDLGRPGMSVTPAILSTTAMSGLLTELDACHGNWAARLQTWLKQGLRSAVWTEYSLYYSFLEKHGRLANFHFEGTSTTRSRGGRTMVSGNSLWRSEDLETWNPAVVFEGEDPASFAVIQSSLRLEVEMVREKLAAWL
jgi:hypothetical protein